MHPALTFLYLYMYLHVMSTTGRGRPRNNALAVDTEAKRIGSLLKYLRTERGVTQKEVADRVDINQAIYSMYESGSRPIPSHRLFVEIVATINARACEGSRLMPPAEFIALPEAFHMAMAA